MMIDFFVSGITAYLLGSIPTAVWVGKLRFGIDIREHGSKNAGATNTFRVLGKKPGIFVLGIDILKGAIAVILPFLWTGMDWNSAELIHLKLVAAIMAVIGHVFPVFARFRGGKGVATSLGVIIGLQPLAALICITLFLIVFIVSGFVSLGAMSSAVLFPLLIAFVFKSTTSWMLIFSVFLGCVVILAHHKNIGRLFKGTENRMNLFKK